MHFTKSQIEEIARRIAILTKKDSEFDPADLPPDGTEQIPIIEYIPLLQDYENRLLSLADLRSMVLENDDQSSIACPLTVNCTTSGVVTYIKGEERTTYNAHYGEMVDVIITADGFDTWYGVVTMTQPRTINVILNETGTGPGPGPTPVPTEVSVVVNSVDPSDAVVKIDGVTINVGQTYYYPLGSSFTITASKEGYETATYSVSNIAAPYSVDIELSPIIIEEEYFRFSPTEIVIPCTGGEAIVEGGAWLQNNTDINWTIVQDTLPDIQDDTPETTYPNQGDYGIPETLSYNFADQDDPATAPYVPTSSDD